MTVEFFAPANDGQRFFDHDEHCGPEDSSVGPGTNDSLVFRAGQRWSTNL